MTTEGTAVTSPSSAQPAPSTGRLAAIDRMRGLVMIIMVLDHVGSAIDADHFFANAAGWALPGTVIEADHFLARLVTHLCAPTFVFLAGTSIALSLAKRGAAAGVGRHLVLRGLIIAAFEPLWVSPIWSLTEPQPFILLQVLYAIGIGLVLMVPLRRLPNVVLILLALTLLGGTEQVAVWLFDPTALAFPLVGGLLFTTHMNLGGAFDFIVAYPLMPWLAMMMLGWVWGRRLVTLRAQGRSPVPGLLLGGAVGLAVFGVLRGLNDYGNHALLRADDSWIQWLHVSKYPPSLTFVGLTLGVMALCLAGFFAWERRAGAPAVPRDSADPLLVFGRAALFFYLVHIPMITVTAWATGWAHQLDLPETYLGTALTCLLLYPACRWYGRYKAAHPDGWARFI